MAVKKSNPRVKTMFILLAAVFMIAAFVSPCRICLATVLDTDAMKTLLSTEALTSPEKLQSDPKAAVLNRAEARFRQGRWEEAARYANQLISMEPGHLEARGILGAVYALTGSPEPAQKELVFLQKAGETGFFSDLIEAILMAQSGKVKEAEKKLSSALQKDADHPVAVYYSASLSLAQEKLVDAEKSFKKVIAAEPDFTPGLAGLGQVYLRQKKSDLAVEYYKKALTNQPEMLMYRKQLIDIYKSTGQIEAADREMKTALYFMPGVKQDYLVQGMQLLAAGAYKDAIKQMDNLIDIYKRIPEAFYIKAAALANLKETKAAEENIESFIFQQWGLPQSHHFAGMCYLALERMDKADQQFKMAVKLAPNMGKSFVPLTVIEQTRGNYDRALDGLKLARTGGEPPVLVDYLSAHVLLAKGDKPGYLNSMKNAAGLISGLKPNTGFVDPPESKTAMFANNRNLMVLYFFNGWYGKTIEFGDWLIKLNRKDRFAWYYLGLAKVAQNNTHDAIDAFEQLIFIEPDLLVAHMGLGQFYMQARNFDKAENAFNKAIAIAPEYGPAYIARGDLFMRTSAETDAIQSYTKAIEVSPDLPGAYQKLAMIYVEKPDKLEKALELALKAEALEPQSPISLDVLGWVYVQKGDIAKALEKLNAASPKLPNDPLIHYHMGVAHYKNNDLKAAQKSLQAAVKMSKNFKGVEHAREILKKISP